MTNRARIAVIAFLTFLSVRACAQFGHVAVHADPRLAVLLKKNPAAVPPVTPVPAAANSKHASKSNSSAPGETPEPINEEAPHHPVLLPAHRDGKVIYAGKGFRVQIYNGYDRDKAIKVRAEFMRSNPGIRAYFSYVSPFFKIKVGDYRTREQAAGMLKEARSDFSPACMIVPDQVAVHAD